MEKTTTIRVSQNFKEKLDKLKISPSESYEDLLKRLLFK